MISTTADAQAVASEELTKQRDCGVCSYWQQFFISNDPIETEIGCNAISADDKLGLTPNAVSVYERGKCYVCAREDWASRVCLPQKNETEGPDDVAAVLGSSTWSQCETYKVEICGTWVYDSASKTIDADWTNGAEATLTAQIDQTTGEIVITRRDTAGQSAGLVAVYRGTVSGGTFMSGKATLTYNGKTESGVWRASKTK